MGLNITVVGSERARKELPEIPQTMQRSALLQMSQIAYDSAERGAGQHSRSGALFQSLYNRSIQGGREVGHDAQRAPHALFVNFGAKPHIIEPKNKQSLRWATGGIFNFARRIHHPGYRGDPYMIRAADDAIRQFDSIINRATQEAS